jgi:hypothetical protein
MIQFPWVEGVMFLVASVTSAVVLVGLPGLYPLPQAGIWPKAVLSVWITWRLWRFLFAVMTYWRWTHLPRLEILSTGISRLKRGFGLGKRTSEGILLGLGYRVTARHTQQLETVLATTGRLPAAEEARGGYPALHAVGAQSEKPVVVRWSELVGHVGLLGATRSGKTRGLEVVVTEAIHEPRAESHARRGAVVVIDPKGDAELLARTAVEAERAGRPFHLVSPAFAERSATLNPMSTCLTPSEVATRIQALMPGAGDARQGDPFFVEFPLGLVEAVAGVQQRLGEPWTVEGLRGPLIVGERQRILLARYLQHQYGMGAGTTQGLRKLIRDYRDRQVEDPFADDLITAFEWDAEHFRRVTANLRPAFRGVTGEYFGPLFSSLPATITWRRIDEESMVVYIALASLMFGEVSHRMGRLILTDLVDYIAQRYAFQDAQRASSLTIVVDEFGRVTYPLFVDALAEGGGAQARFILAMQSEADPEVAMSQAHARQVFGNLNTRVFFRLSDSETASDVSRSLGQCTVKIPEEGGALTFGGSGGLTTRHDRRWRQLTTALWRPEWLTGLPRGESLARIQGELWKVRVPLLTAPDPAAIERQGLAPFVALLRQRAQQEAVEALQNGDVRLDEAIQEISLLSPEEQGERTRNRVDTAAQ